MERVSFNTAPQRKGNGVSGVLPVIGFIALVVALSLVPWRVEFSYRWERGNDSVLAEVKVPLGAGRHARLARFRREKLLDPRCLLSAAQEMLFPGRPAAEQGRAARRRQPRQGGNLRRYAGLAQRLLRTVWIEKLWWVTQVGTGDAGETGVLVGGIWAVKGGLVALLAQRVRGLRDAPELRVVPLFDERRFTTELACIFRATPAHIISAGVRWLLGRARGGGH